MKPRWRGTERRLLPNSAASQSPRSDFLNLFAEKRTRGAVDQCHLVTGRRPMKFFKKPGESSGPQDPSIALRLCAITNRVKSQTAVYEGWSPPNGRP